ncbi:MAG TPA: hypothetical protein VNA69_19620 [Thermoanaerobaculia bacterium]|nr:hypothetical protein [Thermoanaerobaculia bacterium]
MKFRNIVTLAAMILLPLAASAATIVVPAAGTGPGANNSHWQSELTLHSAAPRPLTVSIAFHQGTSILGPVSVTLAARETVSIADIAKTRFGLAAGTGALVLEVSDRDARHLAVTSRTFNTAPEGEFGQDIPAIKVADAAVAGDIAALSGPSGTATTRFNFGLYAVSATTVKWELLRANGTVAASRDAAYAAGEHVQYNTGVFSFLGAAPQDNDTVYARVLTGSIMLYGSAINATGDPTFVPGVRTRDDILIVFAGVDTNNDGTVDIHDADGDGVLDGTVVLITGLYGNLFRVIASGEFGENVELSLVSSPSEITFQDARTLFTGPNGSLRGHTGEIVLRATSGSSSTLLTIPVSYR